LHTTSSGKAIQRIRPDSSACSKAWMASC
jgi:hypothetical protein